MIILLEAKRASKRMALKCVTDKGENEHKMLGTKYAKTIPIVFVFGDFKSGILLQPLAKAATL